TSNIFILYSLFLFFSNHPATSEISTLSLHDALPIFLSNGFRPDGASSRTCLLRPRFGYQPGDCAARWLPGSLVMVSRRLLRRRRSEEHTSELQSRFDLVCRLLLEKKKIITM